mmetsp:Transcript_47280/g.64359  ORF Transcript_47280/g.64359 Transcript_47280/m.64359 type:complete len:211 (-) Transcript_47280:167-799(-)
MLYPKVEFERVCHRFAALPHVTRVFYLTGGFDAFSNAYPFLCSGSPRYLNSGQLFPSQITDEGNVFLSSHALAYDPQILETLQITHVLNVTPDHPNALGAAERGIVYMRIPVVDQADQNLLEYLDQAVNFLDSSTRTPQGRVLVHCRHGQSRSAAVLAAWLMTRKGWELAETIDFLKRRRPRVSPNSGFQEQIQSWVSRREANPTISSGN